MRKFFTFLAVLVISVLVSSCVSNEVRENNAKDNTILKKPDDEFSNASANAEKEAQLDSIDDTDTVAIKSELDSLAQDSLAIKISLPKYNEEFETANYDTLDSIDSEGEDYTDADWFGEDDTNSEDDPGYINYSNGDMNLKKERILNTEIIRVQVPELYDQRDSILAEIERRMSIDSDEISKQIVVEKWYSPVNYRGYKFNRKKLIFYGVDRPTLISIYFYLGHYYFALNNEVFDLDESTKNMAFQTVGDSVLSNYLLSHDNKL